MLSSRKLLRREFFATFLPATAIASPKSTINFFNCRYQLENRVLAHRICDGDHSHINQNFVEGWIYKQTNNSDLTDNPWLGFDHETKILENSSSELFFLLVLRCAVLRLFGSPCLSNTGLPLQICNFLLFIRSY
jgi:hypothetical protein